MNQILITHHARYPAMEIQDMVKLAYQSEWAGGHMIADPAGSLKGLEAECRGLDSSPGREAFEDIGSGLCRLYLNAPDRRELSLSTVNGFFVNTANANKGTIQGFAEKLDALRQCCGKGELPYPVAELDAYLTEHKRRGYPPVHHSQAYRAAYAPAYRVVNSAYRDFFDVFRRIDALLAQKDRVYVAVDGNSGAGKSTLGALINGVYGGNVFHMDDFFLTPELRSPERLREAGGNVDYGRFRKEIIGGLKGGGAFAYRAYNCKTQELKAPVRVEPASVNIIEGSYSMHPTLADIYDMKIFLGIDANEQSRRILARNGDIMHKRFMSEWVPMENRYFAEMGIRDLCDLAYDDGALV